MKCNICNNEFQNLTSLVSHLTNSKSTCKINIKEYYDKFIKKEEEGICIFCGGSTSFYGLNKGYPNNTCKHCKNKKEDTIELRKKIFEKKKEDKKIKNGYYNLPIQCELCKEKNIIYKCKSKQNLSKHIINKHKEINIQDYYDKYLKINIKEGICEITGEKTTFQGLANGYLKYKNKGTNSKDLKIQEKKKETIFKKYNVLNPCFINQQQRIDNFKQTFKEKRILKQHRWKLINLLRKLTIDKTNKLQCQICGKKFNNFRKITSHIFKTQTHNTIIKDYYDKYFKKEKDGICPISNLETNFDCLERGYFKYHKLFITYSDEIKNGNKKQQQNYIQDKIKSFQNIFNVEFVELNSINFIGDSTKIKCLKCNNIYENRFTNLMLGFGKCPKCYPKHTKISNGENSLLQDLKSITNKETILSNYNGLIKNPKTNRSLELDIYFPEKNFAIEFNGLYWHSELILNEKASTYHIIKLNECKKEGVHLFQIFEDEWVNKKDIILSMIKHKLMLNTNKTIYARNCIIKEISSSDKNIFLDNNHIQGKDYSKIKIGSFYNNELVSVMTFGLGNISKGGNPKNIEKWELSRFCTKKEYRIIGIAGKMLNFFKKNYRWSEIYSYADLRFSNGNLYKKLGFKQVGQTQPNYWYVNGMKRIHRFNLRKLPTEPIETPEWLLRLNQGYYRIWDCGNLKFELINN